MEAKLETTMQLLAMERKEKERIIQEMSLLEDLREMEKKNLRFESEMRL